MLLDAICISSHLQLLFYKQRLTAPSTFTFFSNIHLMVPIIFLEEATLVTNNGNSTVNIREKVMKNRSQASFLGGSSVRVDVASKEKLLLRSPSF